MTVIQDILIVILAGYMTIDQNGPVVLSWFSVIVGMISGLIMGDMNTGLVIGGTFQLMSLGVAALGGASAPNYGLATIIGTFIAVRTGTGTDAALAVGLPVGLLAIQLEVVVRIVNNFVAHKMQNDNNAGKWGRMNREAWLGPAICSLQTVIPTIIVVCFGANVVNFILKFIPEWVTNGLSIAAGMPSGSRNRNVDALHAGKEIPSVYFGRICSVRIFGSTGSWNCDYRICCSFLVFLQQSLENQMRQKWQL